MHSRNSNIEILRIISMAMVLLVHFVGGAFNLPSLEDMQSPTTNMLMKIALESIAIIGVNCFILISGYFGIKFSIKGLLKYTFTCLFASLFVFFARTIIDEDFSATLLLESFLIYSHTDLWFVPAYLALFIISPLINDSLKNLKIKELITILACLTFVNVYLGWYHSGNLNPYGYNIMQMLYLYSIGHSLFRLKEYTKKISTANWLTLYCVFTILIAASTFILNSRVAFAYNSPFVLLSSISFFMVFTSRKEHRNNFINFIAPASFMVYLLHKSPYFWLKLKNTLLNFSTEYDNFIFMTVCISLFIAIYILSTIIGIIYNELSKEVEKLFRFRTRQ